MAKKRPIDKVTVSLLDSALRVVDIGIPLDILDNIIDVVELLEDKGDKTTLKDLTKLKHLWETLRTHEKD